LHVTIAENDLDQILALQLTVAWAGEGHCQPPRLGWWRTDIVDPMGGGDLLARLLPKTHLWASLEAARAAALTVDRAARANMADPERLRTLFYMGFELDEQLAERVAALKGGGVPPAEQLSLPLSLEGSFSAEELGAVLRRSAGGEHTVVPGGRQMKGAMPEDRLTAVQTLAAGLVPFTDSYPMPFFRLH
jgi:hypothetical protein